ncbi:hypothetical protein M8A51_15275 [Schlegelella sp. S2-27]|uniref:Cardiolipin synthase N-terminal domain-containing protein n=1 Tax=Caldimonas mangrovi TaxID=2944811 RepID=A0ABT0YQ78_9BURK|nr:hypothetical protein [Caldimonas mangrovi]MCM5680886.1 hypothetical protein [Caldimonas mangrovi]
MEVALALAIVVIPLGLSVQATRLVVGDVLCERRQKLAQLLLVWLVPLIGAAIVLAVHRSAQAPSRRYREPVDPGDDFGLSGRSVKNIQETLDGAD